MTPDKTKEVIEERLGKSLDEVFEWIDLEKPLGSASIAQVRLTAAFKMGNVTHSVHILLMKTKTTWQNMQAGILWHFRLVT